jgi:hypothetical protein
MNMPLPRATWTTGTTEAIKTGTWRAALPHYMKAPSPCHRACPVNGDIADWIGLARERDFRGAWEVLVRHNPFPAIAGRICHHPCESACNRGAYDDALAMGLVNAVVPHEQLDAQVQKWCDEIAEKSPTALAIAKRSFNMDTAHQAGIAGMGLYALKLYYDTEESREGVKAFQEKRKPDFRRWAK